MACPFCRSAVSEISDVPCNNTMKQEQPMCSICLEEFQVDETVSVLQCGHFFHKECIAPWLGVTWDTNWVRPPPIILAPEFVPLERAIIINNDINYHLVNLIRVNLLMDQIENLTLIENSTQDDANNERIEFDLIVINIMNEPDLLE